MEILDLIQELRQGIIEDEDALSRKQEALRILESSESAVSPVKATRRGRPPLAQTRDIAPASESKKRPGWSEERRARTLAAIRKTRAAKLALKIVAKPETARTESTPKMTEPAKSEAPDSPQADSAAAKRDLIQSIKSVKPSRSAKKAIPVKAAKKSAKKVAKKITAKKATKKSVKKATGKK